MRISFFIIIFSVILNISTWASTGAMALDIAENAYEKNIGFGGAALFNNLNGVSCNPSVIPNIHSLNGTMTYINYIYDYQMIYGNILYPNFYNYNILGKFAYFSAPPTPAISNFEESGQNYTHHEFLLGFGTGYQFLDKQLSIGGIASFYYSNLADTTGTSYILDLGANYPYLLPLVKQHKIILGLSLLNLGPGIKFVNESSPLPMNMNLGFQYIYDFNYKLFAGLRKYFEYKPVLYSLGGEILITQSFSLRASMTEDLNKNYSYNFGLGFDLNYTDYHFLLDYAFLPLTAQDSSYIITLSFQFPLPSEKEREQEKDDQKWENLWTSH